jgi:HEAT repeat protein
VVLVALRYARDFFDYAAMFAVTRDAIWGHDALGPEEGAREACRGVAVAIEEPGFFGPAIETAGPYLGPVAPGPASDAVLTGLGRGAPRTVLLYPVVVGDRPVCVLYADNGEAPVSPRRLGDLLLLASSLGAALERVIRQRKAGGRPGAAVGEPWKATEPGLAEPALPGSVEVDLGDFEVGSPAKVLAAPPDLDAGAAVERLAASARGSPERGSLIAQLVQRGAEAARFLCARLPGPIEVKSQALAEATPVYEQGPILAALAALGTPATADLLAVLADPDPERRRYAVLTLGHIADPAAIAGLAERVFDPDPRVAAAARGASAALRREPQMRPVVEGLRQALVSASPERAAQAARALARLGDAEAVPLLIQLLEAGDRAADGAAAEALTRITMQRLGESPGRWLGWWHENRGAPRASWLFAALSDPDREVRAAAAEELRAAGLPPVAYIADAPLAEREQAARAWAAWWESTGMTI